MASVFPSANYISQFFNLSTTAETSVYTVPDGVIAAYVVQLWAADDAGEARTLTIEANAGGTDYMLGYQIAIATNVPLDYEFKPMVLVEGDTIDLTASAAGIHGFVTIHELVRVPAVGK